MVLIGLTGERQQGKSTVSELLRACAPGTKIADLEYSDALIKVSNHWLQAWPSQVSNTDFYHQVNALIAKLPDTIKLITGRSIDHRALLVDSTDQASLELHKPLLRYLDSLSAPVTITRENKVDHRLILQWVAGRLRHFVGPTIWSEYYDGIIKRHLNDGFALVTLGGLRHQAEAEHLKSVGGIVIRVSKPKFIGAGVDDPYTEQTMRAIIPDTEIVNNGTLLELKRVVDKLWADIARGYAEPRYSATN